MVTLAEMLAVRGKQPNRAVGWAQRSLMSSSQDLVVSFPGGALQ